MRTEFLPMTTNHSWNSSDAQGIIQAGWYRQRLGSTQCVSHKPHSVCRLCWIFLYFYLFFLLFIFFLFVVPLFLYIYLAFILFIYWFISYLFISFLHWFLFIFIYWLHFYLFYCYLVIDWFYFLFIPFLFIYLFVYFHLNLPLSPALLHSNENIDPFTSTALVAQWSYHQTATAQKQVQDPRGGGLEPCV